MQPGNHTTDNARSAISGVLAGNAPNGIAPADCGEWAGTVSAVFDGYAGSGTEGARRVWATIAKANPGAARLVADDGAGWGPVLPFHSAELPAFPLDVFPTWLREYCDAVTEAMQTPPDLAGMLALSVLSTACARRIGVRAWAGWDEPVNVFTVTSLGPGNRKSVVFRAMTAPLIKFEKDLAEACEAEIFQAEARRDVLKQQIEGKKRKAANIEGENALRAAFAEIDEMGQELRELVIPTRPKLIVDDVTPETIASILAEQDGRLAVLSPEGDIFGIMAGRYSSGPPNIGVYLKGHAGDAIRVDRKTRSEYVQAPALTMGITTQPEVMRSFGSNSAFRGQGLLARFFYALPVSTVGSRRAETEQIPDQVRATYFNYMLRLLENLNSVHSVHSVQGASDSVHSGTDPQHQDSNNIYYIEISGDAKERLVNFMDWIEPQIGPFGALASVADWASKLAGAALRVAGLLHMAQNLGQNGQNGQNCVTDNEMARAIRLCHYLLAHAQAAYAEIGADPAVEAARIILRWIDKTGQKTFTRRDCYRGVRGPLFKSADDCDGPLSLLADHNYVREIDTAERGGPGRKPAPSYEVNPQIFGQNGQNGQNTPPQGVGASYSAPDDTYEAPTWRAIGGYDE